MDKWSKERNEHMKWFQDKQKEEENGSSLHRNLVCCLIHTLVFNCMMTFTCLLSCILLSFKVFISKFSSSFCSPFYFLFLYFGFSLFGIFSFLQSFFFLGSLSLLYLLKVLLSQPTSWLSFLITTNLVKKTQFDGQCLTHCQELMKSIGLLWQLVITIHVVVEGLGTCI